LAQWRIIEDDLTGPEVRALLELHFAGMLANSPPGSCHFLDFEGLNGTGVTFWTIWDGPNLAGCGALKVHNADLGEIKSMRTHADFLGQGAGSAMLQYIIESARAKSLSHISLETGSSEAFLPALSLYAKFGFFECPPFADYKEDPFSRFLSRKL
jgi:putative acetyltransferase